MESPAASWLAYCESWHDFYLMAGTAAVTLAGLLFVALSLHIDALIHERRDHLLALARVTQFSFIMVLILSLMMLMPGQNIRIVGWDMVAVSGVFLVFTLRMLRWKPKSDHAEFSAARMRRRLILPIVGYGIVLMAGLGLMRTHDPDMMHFVIGGICMLLGNAAGTSWDLLVGVARIKRGDAPH
jgi:hypothetical protein